MAHIVSLGLETVESYKTWCRENGLNGAVNKGWQERRSEKQLAEKLKRNENADAALTGMKRHSRRPRDTIKLLYEGELDQEELRHTHLTKMHDALGTLKGDTQARKAFLDLLLHIEQHGDLLGTKSAISVLGPQEGNTFIEGMRALASHHEFWVHPLDQ